MPGCVTESPREDCKLVEGSSPSSLFMEGFFSLVTMASFTRLLMVLFSSGSNFTLCGLMLWPVAWECSKTAEISWDWCYLIRVLEGTREGTRRFGQCINFVRTTPSSAESRKPLPVNKGDPSWIDMRAWTYHQFSTDLRAKRAKATFCLKFNLLLISSSFCILWPKEQEGLDWLF